MMRKETDWTGLLAEAEMMRELSVKEDGLAWFPDLDNFSGCISCMERVEYKKAFEIREGEHS